MEFLSNSSEENFSHHVLYYLLNQYLQIRSKIKVNLMDMQSFRERIAKITPDIWKMQNQTLSYSGICGDNLTVTGIETYKVAVIDDKTLESTCILLAQLHELVCFSHTANLVHSEVTKLRIEQAVREILSYPVFEKIKTDSPVALNTNRDKATMACLNHLRIAISIFFSFLRKPTPDKLFSNDVKVWLTKLVALQLRVAGPEDHWFLLFHILRCPSGISSWATSIVQVPPLKSPDKPGAFVSHEVDHCISYLSILLMPIRKRNEFLRACAQAHKDISDPVKDDLWILVDSDGEEGVNASGECIGLKESDLIALLNQIPFEMLFCSILNIDKSGDNYNIMNETLTGNQLVKIISFCTTLIELLGEGLVTYNTERYKQFAKRLGRLIRHCIQYIFDFHELYMNNNLSKDPYLCERINVEFGAFILKSCKYIYKSRSLGTWQYFSSLPFSSLDIGIIWELFYFLNVGFPEELISINEDFQCLCNKPDFWDKFNSTVPDISDDDLYFLLQTFLGIAVSRDRTLDWDFIRFICSHIFIIGFINESTRETCYKTSKDMITNIILVHPDLVTDLLKIVKTRFTEIENMIYLFKLLPLEKWIPDMDSFEVLAFWLLNYSYEMKESVLARIIISHLNWEFNSENELFLPQDIHVRMACLICEAATKHVPEIIGQSGISESVRQVSIESQTTKEQFITWCWSMISTLRLHHMDQSKETIKRIMQNPGESLKFIPEVERIQIVFQGISESRPLAIFLSVLISLWGHSIPLICQKGFAQLHVLLQDYRHAAVIRCLNLITPLFLECPEILSKCESFQELIKQLLNSDRTYMKMAKDLVSANSPGPVLELLGNMLQAQIINYTSLGLTSPKLLINLWLECLTHTPNWQSPNVFHLIDIILKIAYQFPDSWYNAKEYFRYFYRNLEEPKASRSALQMLLGSNINRKFPAPSGDFAWFTLISLELEHEMCELETRLWPELLRQLKLGGKTYLENVLKKTVSTVGCPAYQSSSLVLFKYANAIASSQTNHPLLPIICQKFFMLYLARIPLHEDEERYQEIYGVADKFYESNISLMKKVKAKLKQAEDFCNSESHKQKGSDKDAIIHFYSNCAKIYKTYLLWLEETSINKISRNQNIQLPPQFNTDKLLIIFSGEEQHWTEFLYLPFVRNEQKECATRWLKSCFRQPIPKKSTSSHLLTEHKTTPRERIIAHLKTYDKPIDPPQLVRDELILKQMNAKDINNSTLTQLKSYFKVLDESAKKFNFAVREINSLDGNYKDCIRLLYTHIRYQQRRHVKCSSIFSKSMLTCAKPAVIELDLKKPKKDENIERNLENNREKHDKLIEQQLQQNLSPMVIAMEKLEHTIKYLALFQTESQDKKTVSKYITDVSIQFFYEIIKNLNENIIAFTPAHEICMSLLTTLGIFIQENQESQGIKILETALKRPELIKLFSELFVPSKTSPDYFINMYKFLIDSHMRRCDTKILFVLISKFDLQNWLQNYRPKLSEITRLLKLILAGLENWNQAEASILQGLFRRHLIHVFEHEFPEHYGEVLQIVLSSSSEQKLHPSVLMDLINSLLVRNGCDPIDFNSHQVHVNEQIRKFATQQNLFNFKSITDTIELLSRHFQNERLQHGLHGLYPKHKDYCQILSILFACFGHAAVVSAIYAYPGELADQISDWLFAPIVEIYSPWLVIYSGQNLQQSTANWIRQLIANGKILYPWSELHKDSAQLMIQSFVQCLQFILESLPVSSSVLGNVLGWYEVHLAKQDIPQHLRAPFHNALAVLPWYQFYPQPANIDTMYKILFEFLPECHSFMGFIFLQIPWTSWMQQSLSTWNYPTQTHIISVLFIIYVQISFEPNVHEDPRTSKILEECLNFSWNMIEYQGIETAFNWVVTSVEPSVILEIPSNRNSTDIAVINLLKYASGMTLLPNKSNNTSAAIQAKRIIYVRTVIRLLRTCGAKYQKLLATAEGMQAYQNSLIELLQSIEEIVNKNMIDRNHSDVEAFNLMTEIIGSLQSQSEYTSNLFVGAILKWQSKCDIGSVVLCNTLNAIGMCKSFIFSMYSLLEATIYNYFKSSEDTKNYHSPTWSSLFQRLGRSVEYLDLTTLIQGSFLLSLHTFLIYKLQSINDIGKKITFLLDVSQLLENIKTSEMTEPRIAIIWGAIISAGCDILEKSDNGKKPLLMLARYLQTISTQAEGWGDGLLGAIGLKRDTITNKRKILTRCLSCLIFSSFPDTSNSEDLKPSQEFIISLEELKTTICNKKYADIKLIAVKAIEIVESDLCCDSQKMAGKISNIINLLYNESFLTSINEVWCFEKCS